jgi:hypothetical protein
VLAVCLDYFGSWWEHNGLQFKALTITGVTVDLSSLMDDTNAALPAY